MATTPHHFPLGGGLDLKTPAVAMKPGKLLQAQNVEQKVSGGYRRIDGYEKFDTNVVPGEGNILGVWYFNDKVYAFRNATGGATAEMHESTGSGWTTKQTGLAPDGDYEFLNYNFAGTFKMYGSSGVHKGFEWDGTTWTDITTGMAVDTPEHVIAHRKHLFYNFGYSVQHSGLGTPATFTPVTGAAEVAVEDGVTGFLKSAGSLVIFGRNSTNLLRGSSSTDWTNTNFAEHGNHIGAIRGSMQQLGSRLKYLDDRGLTDLATSDKYGDFADAVVSYDVNDILLPKRTNVTCSCVIKNKSQYRIFFDDGGGMIFTFVGSKLAGATRLKFNIPVLKVVASEDANGEEVIYFGSTDGYIYEMEKGNSFDGSAMSAYMRTAYNHMGSPRKRKRFRRVAFDMHADGAATISVKPDFRIETDGIIPPPGYTDVDIAGGGSLLGTGLLGSFILGAGHIQEGEIDMPGHGSYVSLFFHSNEVGPAWEIDGIIYDYILGRGRR